MTLQQDALSSGEDKLETAREEIAWISETFSSANQLEAVPDILEDDSVIRIPTLEPLQDLIDAVGHYLNASFEIYPEPAADAEQALARMILDRGLSSGDVVSIFATALRRLDALQPEPPFSPALCLTRLLAVLVERQQKSAAFGAMRRAA